MYIGYIQFFLIGIVFLNSFRDSSWGEYIFRYALISIPVALIAFILISLALGYLDSKLGLREEEYRNLSASNPVLMEILRSVNEIKDELNTIRKSSK
jgi:hypothetical protein